MKSWALVPFALTAGILAFNVATAPPSFVFLGRPVYHWADPRMTLLEVAVVLSFLLLMATSGRPRALSLASVGCALFCGTTLLTFVVFNYATNAPDGALPQLFSTGAAMTLLGFMYEFRLSPIYGLAVQTVAWFCATTLAVFCWRFGRGVRLAVLDAAGFAAAVLAAYAAGVLLIIPQWSARMITGLQAGTAVAWFTNDDLLLVAALSLLSLTALRARLGVAHRRARVDHSQRLKSR